MKKPGNRRRARGTDPIAELIIEAAAQAPASIEEAIAWLAQRLNIPTPAAVVRQNIGIHDLPRMMRRRLCDPFLTEAAGHVLGGRAPAIDWTLLGKPYVPGHQNVYLAVTQNADTTVALAAECEVGCDLAMVAPKSSERWASLLSGGDAQLRKLCGDEPLELAATRLWAAQEALKKATRNAAALELAARDGELVCFSAGGIRVGTLPVRTQGQTCVFALALAAPRAAG